MHDYLAQQAGAEIAGAFVNDLAVKILWIAEAGFTGAPRDHIAPGLRAHPYRGRCIYFRTDETTVYVLRVVHGAQDIERIAFPAVD